MILHNFILLNHRATVSFSLSYSVPHDSSGSNTIFLELLKVGFGYQNKILPEVYPNKSEKS
ncbi:hypothetical protein CRYUN_Cryun05aG0072700 [Craigia yunnanensis]